MLRQTGASLPLTALRGQFPGVPRAELARILSRYRRVVRRRQDEQTARLTWHLAGTVWAIDFLKPPTPVDGVAPAVLAVRDLASGYQLLWQPFESETAAVTCAALERLFQQWGPPLVLKADNGSAFIAEATADLLSRWRITSLFSPPRRPQYNGACERGNGTLRIFTDEAALLNDRPAVWLSQDLQQALQVHNEIHRPQRLDGATPDHVWQRRPAITEDQRRLFLERVETCRRALRLLWHQSSDEAQTRAGRAALGRIAARDALCSLGYLTIQRRRTADRARFCLLATASPGATASPILRTQPTLSAPAHDAVPPTTNCSPLSNPSGIITAATPASDSLATSGGPAAPRWGQGVIHTLRRLITLLFPRQKAARLS
ncbi:MAG: transposase [Acidobacteria bacterium]|nr:transposase [Acidobacteriota bacterium]